MGKFICQSGIRGEFAGKIHRRQSFFDSGIVAGVKIIVSLIFRQVLQISQEIRVIHGKAKRDKFAQPSLIEAKNI